MELSFNTEDFVVLYFTYFNCISTTFFTTLITSSYNGYKGNRTVDNIQCATRPASRDPMHLKKLEIGKL